MCLICKPLVGQEEPTRIQQLADAIHFGQIDVVRETLSNNPELIEKKDRGFTPLVLSIIENDPNIARVILEKGADPNRLHNHSKSVPILEARTITMIDLLIEFGARYDVASIPDGRSPVTIALENRNIQPARYFAELGAPVDFDAAVQLGMKDRVAELLADRPWLAKPPSDCLFFVARTGDIELTKLLLAHGADPNLEKNIINASRPYTPLTVALHFDRFEISKLLLDAGGNPNVVGNPGDNLLFHAVAFRDLEYMVELLKHGCYVEQRDRWGDGLTALHIAASLGGSPYFEKFNYARLTRSPRHETPHVLERVKLLLANHADVNAKAKDGSTPLLFAALSEHAEVCNLLLKSGAAFDIYSAVVLGENDQIQEFLSNYDAKTINKKGPLGLSLLHYAALYGDATLVSQLLELGADVHAAVELPSYSDGESYQGFGSKGIAPLHLAAAQGADDVIQVLVDAGAEVNVQGSEHIAEGRTPLAQAVYREHVSSIKLLLQLGANADLEYNEIRPFSATFNVDGLRLLIDSWDKQQIEEETWSRLLDAGIEKPEVVQLILEHGGRLNVHQACWLGRVEVLEPLLQKDASLLLKKSDQYHGRTPIELAIQYAEPETVKKIFSYLDLNVLTDEQHSLLVIEAVHHGQLELLKLLLSKGFEFPKKSNGFTLLHHAATGNQPAMLQYLLESGFDVDQRDNFGHTALDSAVRSAELRLIRDPLDESQLLTTIQVLIDSGADVNRGNHYGFTPLHKAAEVGFPQLVDMLLKHGANANPRNLNDVTPLRAAKLERSFNRRPISKNGFLETIQMLEAHGGIE